MQTTSNNDDISKNNNNENKTHVDVNDSKTIYLISNVA